MDTNPIHLADLQRLFQTEAPLLDEYLGEYLEQEDPNPFAVAGPEPVEGEEAPEVVEQDPPEGWISFSQFESELRRAGRRRTRGERKKAAHEVWQRYLAQDPAHLPPRFVLGDMIEGLYDRGTPGARALLLEIIENIPLKFGAWRGLKRLFKRTEAALDFEVFGALAARVDAGGDRGSREVSHGTLLYLKRRAWRALRRVGEATPELYPQVAAQVLRHYREEDGFSGLWVGNHIVGHGTKRYGMSHFYGSVPDDMVKHRAFPDAWKHAPDTLMFLLEACRCDVVARFAIQGLKKEFPERLRGATPEWLARLMGRRFESVDEFVVETLEGSPDLHQGKLRALGLHDAVLSLLKSGSKKARKYAAEYARAHARDLEKERLLDLLGADDKEVIELAKTLLIARPPRELGHEFLGKLLAFKASNDWAVKSLNESFERAELPQSFLVEMLFGDDDEQFDWAKKYIDKKYPGAELGVAFWKAFLDDKRADDKYDARGFAFKCLGKYKAAEIGAGWMLDALAKSWLQSDVEELLKKATSLPGLDVERVKGLVFNRSYRDVALSILGNQKLVSSRELGLPWLLALAKRADESLHEFAHRYLLEHMKPAEFADGDAKAGVARLFELALGQREAEPVRSFAQTYLLCHHPVLGHEQPKSKQFDLKPFLKDADYDREALWGALFDGRADVRQFGLTLVKPHLRAWGFHLRVQELVDLDPKEVRNLAYEAMQGAGDEGADPAVALKLDELSAAAIFQMTESPKRPTRDVAMELIRKHYSRLGGAERLGWLMQSADREVRLFAVRMLWEKHRPRSFPAGWKPRKAAGVPLVDEGAFADVEALRGLLRRLLFGLPPGRAPAGDQEGKRRHVSASVVKKNVIDLVRDLGVEDAAFAALVAPVLGEFTGSLARGEWQACLSALAHIDQAHPELKVLRALWRNTTSDISKKSGR